MKDSESKTEKTFKEEEKAEEITVRVPKAVMNFLTGHVKNPEQYVQNAVLRQFQGDINSDQYFYAPERIIKLYNLAPIFEQLRTTRKED